MERQLFFDLEIPEPSPELVADDVVRIRRKDNIRAVLAWLINSGVTGAAANVPTRIKRYQADVDSIRNANKEKALEAVRLALGRPTEADSAAALRMRSRSASNSGTCLRWSVP